MSNTVSIGAHIINRLKELGIDTIFGVPGDCTLVCIIWIKAVKLSSNI